MFEDVWKKIEKQFNLAERETVTMTTENFKKAMLHAYTRGEREAEGKELFNNLFSN